MGVYVKHFKLPVNCVWCAVWKGCKAQDWASRDRPENCPLVEVPTPHGRLIDANELFNSIAEKERLLSFDHSGLYVDISEINDVFKHIETVVEAEGE